MAWVLASASEALLLASGASALEALLVAWVLASALEALLVALALASALEALAWPPPKWTSVSKNACEQHG